MQSHQHSRIDSLKNFNLSDLEAYSIGLILSRKLGKFKYLLLMIVGILIWLKNILKTFLNHNFCNLVWKLQKAAMISITLLSIINVTVLKKIVRLKNYHFFIASVLTIRLPITPLGCIVWLRRKMITTCFPVGCTIHHCIEIHPPKKCEDYSQGK